MFSESRFVCSRDSLRAAAIQDAKKTDRLPGDEMHGRTEPSAEVDSAWRAARPGHLHPEQLDSPACLAIIQFSWSTRLVHFIVF